MIFKRVVGFVMLFAFLGFLTYKFLVLVSDQDGSGFITFLVVLILIVLILGIRKILSH
jgi:hypothetical protein